MQEDAGKEKNGYPKEKNERHNAFEQFHCKISKQNEALSSSSNNSNIKLQ